jgi:hypothetical protein
MYDVTSVLIDVSRIILLEQATTKREIIKCTSSFEFKILTAFYLRFLINLFDPT